MNASFEEKSVWVQLFSIVAMLGFYLVVASRMLAEGVMALVAYVPLFVIAVVLLVILMTAGHIVAAIASRPEGRDERDRLIGWRAESNSSWLLAAGVIVAINAMVFGVDAFWIAHLLLLSLFLSGLLGLVMKLVYYRRGV